MHVFRERLDQRAQPSKHRLCAVHGELPSRVAALAPCFEAVKPPLRSTMADAGRVDADLLAHLGGAQRAGDRLETRPPLELREGPASNSCLSLRGRLGGEGTRLDALGTTRQVADEPFAKGARWLPEQTN